MDYKAFVDGPKTLIISPAGYGKTHTIAECLKHTFGKQLILTHTHAGVSSIKEKIKKTNTPPSTYSVETISSFAQKYVHAFYTGTDIPDQDAKNYHSFVSKKSIGVFESKIVKEIISKTYAGLFVDEYQDCTKDQHAMIVTLSNVLPTHILGDPLQGIFDFNDDVVNFGSDLSEFEKFPELSIPHRWYQEGNNKELGNIIKGLRGLLEKKSPIVFSPDDDNGFHVMLVQAEDFWNTESNYRKGLRKIINNPEQNPDYESLLIIVPEYEDIQNGKGFPRGGINDRVKMRTQIDYSKSLKLLEAIDDKAFYSIAKKTDELLVKVGKAHKPIKKINEDILNYLFNKTDLKKWINDDVLVNKSSQQDKEKSEKIKVVIINFLHFPSAINLLKIILEIRDGLKLRYKREEVAYSLRRCLKQSEFDQISVYEAMKKNRNTIRRSGRKVHGKCIGTTLLTKGLEFDTVAILDAHKFDCPKHLYVALTRGCKRLIIFTNKTTLSPYKTT